MGALAVVALHGAIKSMKASALQALGYRPLHTSQTLFEMDVCMGTQVWLSGPGSFQSRLQAIFIIQKRV